MPTKSFRVVRDFAPADALRGAVVAIGNFDGVHRGHRAVIAAALARARSLGRSLGAAGLTVIDRVTGDAVPLPMSDRERREELEREKVELAERLKIIQQELGELWYNK